MTTTVVTPIMCTCGHARRLHNEAGLCAGHDCACTDYDTPEQPDTDEFSAIEVCQLTGCSYRQLDFWTRAERVRTSVAATGSGSARKYSRSEVDIIATALALEDTGFQITSALKYARQMVETGAPIVAGIVTIGAPKSPENIPADIPAVSA